MGEEYEKWLAQTLEKEAQSDYIEPSVQELVSMMDAIPTPIIEGNDEWVQINDRQVLPLSLTDYWDAFFANDAPYYVHAILRDPSDIFIEERLWSEPQTNKTWENQTVIQERYIHRRLRVYQALAPKHCSYYIELSLLVKNETHIRIHEKHWGDECPYSDRAYTNVLWDILTPDPRSNQIIHRNIYQIYFR